MINRQGFTLIEMLVVVAIIGLLSSVVVVGLGSARMKARDAKRLADVQQILNTAEINFGMSGYPLSNNPIMQAKWVGKGPQGENYYYYGGTTSSAAMACMETLENGAKTTKPTGCQMLTTTCINPRPYYFCKVSAQ